MRAEIFFAVLTLSPLAFGANDDCTALSQNLYDQTKALDCEIRKVAEQIRESKDVVPKAIYHFGKRPLLEEDIAAGNVPENAWNDFIMGDKTRYHLEENRRGLYGSVGIDRNGFGSQTYNWLMEIRIKDSTAVRRKRLLNDYF